MKKIKYEVWATFPTGRCVRVETHKSERAAQSSIDAMNNKNSNDLAVGYGFPSGVPTYTIKPL